MFASSYMTALVSLILCCGPVQPEVSVKVSPERSQHFQYEPISVSCEEEGRPVSWSVRKNTSGAVNAACSDGWGETESCTINSAYASVDSGVYWCQSKTGGVSQSITITVSDGDVILQSPVHPVPEGGDVTLRCLSKDQTGKPSSDRPVDFYRNGSLFRAESTGQMTILHVNKSDEGFYKCSISDLGPSPQTWMGVGGPCCVRPVQSGGTNQSGGPGDDVYLPLQHGNTSTYGVINNSAADYVNDNTSDYEEPNPAHDNENVPGSSRRQHAADPVYSNVRNQER